MKITFTRTTTYTLSVDDDDDATLTTVSELLADIEGDSLHAKLGEVCWWDNETGIKALMSLAEHDDDDDMYEVTDYDIDGLEPSEDEAEAEAEALT